MTDTKLKKYQTAYKFKIKASKISGKGLFAETKVPARKKIGEITGEIISIRKARQLAKTMKTIAIIELDDYYAMNATNAVNEFKYINHSCSPNTYIRIFKHHVEFYTLRPLSVGEELTSNYGETHHEGTLKCKCGAKGCVGFI